MSARFRELGPLVAGLWVLFQLAALWAARVAYPFDLEWMEGGMLAHAWRLERGLPLYGPPSLEFAPYVYPPGYPALLAALGQLVPLSMPLGRVVSLVGIGAAALASAFVVRRRGGGRAIAFGAAVTFLGTYDAAGAFYDLVRPDSLAIGLAAWSVALALEEERGAPVAAGLLLAASTLCKHNLVALAPALALGIAWRSGWRSGLAFALAAVLPAAAVLGILQARSDGALLAWLVEVPLSHPTLSERVWPETPRELGTPLPLAFAVIGLWAVHRATERARPRWLGAVVPVWLGMGVAWLGTYRPPAPDSGMYNVPAGFAFWSLAATPVAALIALRRRPSWRVVLGLGVGAAAVAIAAWMRAHNGGFLNVHAPAMWVVATGMGVVLARWRLPGLASAVVTLQLLWLALLYDRDKLAPTPEDEALGWRFVEALRGVEGPVLSPYAAWLPVYAGHPPSVHYMGVWDADYPGNPFRSDLDVYRQALAERYWSVIVGGNQRFLDGLLEHYEVGDELVEADAPPLMPKTGWRARPWRLLVPGQGS